MNKFPKIFIASSSSPGSKSIANEIRTQLNAIADVHCWFDPMMFSGGKTVIEELIRISNEYDMGIFIFNTDDELTGAGESKFITRDNVLFEYGLFVSKVGSRRSFIFYPENLKDFHLPTDLLGLNFKQFHAGRNLANAVIPLVDEVKTEISVWEKQIQIHYIERFVKEVEPPISKGGDIEFNRSFNLLLYMFANESFLEFRALDLAFGRWEEAFRDGNSASTQITNYSKDIVSSVSDLYRTKRCSYFRRILVIPVIEGIEQGAIEVLKLMRYVEEEAKASNPQGTFETRIFRYTGSVMQHKAEFKNYNDFALFTGQHEEFAIVETTLVSPFNNANPGHCVILTDAEKLKRRKDFFDFLWDHEAVSIDLFLHEHEHRDKSHTIDNAFNILYDKYKYKIDNNSDVAIIVETAYVELIKLEDKRRNIPFERAFELLNQVNATPKFKGNIYLDSFINDFRPKSVQEKECSESCEIEDTSPDQNFSNLKHEVTERLKTINNHFDIHENLITTFYMTKTRSNATKSLKIALTEKKELFAFDDPRPDGTRDISIISKKLNKIDLGYQKQDDIVPNCALLMAQHYFELFNFALKANPAHRDIWIFDFLILDEKKYANEGAEAARLLFDWPKGKNLNIVNCTYDEFGLGDVRNLGPFNF